MLGMRTIVLHKKSDGTAVDVPIVLELEGSTSIFSTTVRWNDNNGDKRCEIVKESVAEIQAKINNVKSD